MSDSAVDLLFSEQKLLKPQRSLNFRNDFSHELQFFLSIFFVGFLYANGQPLIFFPVLFCSRSSLGSFGNELLVMNSKRLPKRLTIHANDGKDHMFLVRCSHQNLHGKK